MLGVGRTEPILVGVRGDYRLEMILILLASQDYPGFISTCRTSLSGRADTVPELADIWRGLWNHVLSEWLDKRPAVNGLADLNVPLCQFWGWR